MIPPRKSARSRAASIALALGQGTRRSLRLAIVMSLAILMGAGCAEQNGSDTPTGGIMTPTASFTQGVTVGTPGLAVQFADTSTGPVTTRSWDFGNGVTSTDVSPLVVYADEGLYTVSLTVEGGRGTSTMTSTNLVQVAPIPTAGFDCTTAIGFAPVLTACTNSGTTGGSTTSFLWDFGDGTTSTAENPSHTYTTPGDYTVTQTITTAGGSASETLLVRALPLTITATPGSGAAPGNITFSADTGGESGEIELWMVNGLVAGTGNTIVTPLNAPGTYTVLFQFGKISPALVGAASIQYEVGFGAPVAAFAPSEVEAPGPLSVVLNDQSSGDLIAWEWDFGDGTSCDFPSLITSTEVCDAASPTHVYDEVDRYDVSLRVTGRGQNPGDPDLTDSVSITDAVTVTILDPSFESQIAGEEIGAGWESLRPVSALEQAEHIALSTSQSGGPDAGMPSDGSRWAALDGLGTDGSTTALLTENGIRAEFIRPETDTVLEFDYVLLYSEPTLAGVLDAMTATVSDGATSVEITSARADVETPNAGGSGRFPTLDGSTTRTTPLQTASLDLATAFPGAGPDTRYTLTIRLSNAVNTFRSPRAYVDGIRFTTPQNPITADFALETNPVVAGQAAQFTDETCPASNPSCELPTSWRWDFDTHLLVSPPPTSGSGEQNPSYVFPEAGLYDVTLLARNGDQESLATMTVSVIGAPVASFTAEFPGTTEAPNALVVFTDTSTSDPTDPIVDWSWDFGGFGVASTQGPHSVTFPQSGALLIRLTVTTASGLSNTGSMSVTID